MSGLNLGQFGKAAFGGLVAFLGSLTVVMIGDVGFGDVTDGQWLASVLEGLVVAGGVYGIPYVPRKP
jgi:hypothetical protein